MKRYFLKYNVEAGEVILDSSRDRVNLNEALVIPNRITQTQGKRLKKRLVSLQEDRKRKLFFNEVEHEFKKMFEICKTCGFVSDKVNKAWKGECEKCFRVTQEEKRREYQATKDYRKQLRKYKLHLKTLQGRIDSVPVALIESNVRIEMEKQSKKWKDLASFLGIRQSEINRTFTNKTIRKEFLLNISEFLMVPVEKFLRVPKGHRIKYKDGVPRFWLEEGFVIRNYSDELKEL